jgi:hypothetical protein
MASGRAADREDPNNSKRRAAARTLDRDPISELHQGQRSDAPHQRAGHMTAPDHFAEILLNILRRRGPSTYDFCKVRRGARFGYQVRLLSLTCLQRRRVGTAAPDPKPTPDAQGTRRTALFRSARAVDFVRTIIGATVGPRLDPCSSIFSCRTGCRSTGSSRVSILPTSTAPPLTPPHSGAAIKPVVLLLQ